MVEFEWISDEEKRWGEQSPPPPSSPRRWQRWLLAAAALVLLLLAALYWRGQRSLEAIEAEVRRSHDLVFSSAQAGDLDLLRRLLAPWDEAWQEPWLRMAEGKGWLDRGGWGLDLVGRTNTPVSVALNPGLTQAGTGMEVVYRAPALGASETVSLTLPAPFTRSNRGRWLLAPPPPSYWGERLMRQGKHLRLYYPARDAEVARRLLADLDAALQRLCLPEKGYDCPDALGLNLSLSTDAAILAQEMDLPAAYPDAAYVQPTLSLLGLPQDERGYRALRAGYARRLLAPVLAELTGYDCCAHIVYFAALLEWEMRALGLAQWPLAAADYADLLLEGDIAFNLRVDVGWDVTDLAGATPVQRRAALAIVDFILSSDPQLTAADVLAHFGPRWQRFITWMEELIVLHPSSYGLGVDWPPGTFGQASSTAVDNGNTYLYRFLAERAELTVQPPPQPFPAAGVVLACREGEEAVLLRYRPQADRWDTLLRLPGMRQVYLASTPKQDALWLVNTGADEGETATYLWQEGELLPISEMALLTSVFVSADGERMVVSGWREGMRYYEVALDRCGAGGCEFEPVAGYVRWSPGGRYRLVRDMGDRVRVTLVDAAGRRLHEFDAVYPTVRWLDAGTYIWSDGAYLYRYRLASGLTDLLLSAEQVGEVAPHHINQGYDIAGVHLAPGRPQRLLLTIRVDAVVDIYYVVEYDLDGGQLRWLEAVGQAVLYEDPAQTPYLTGASFHGDGQRFNLLVYDAGREQARIYPTRSSADASATLTWQRQGEWLLAFGAGYARLIAPRLDYQRPAFPPLPTCTSAAWLGE